MDERILRITAKPQNRKGGESENWVLPGTDPPRVGERVVQGIDDSPENMVAAGTLEHRKRETGHRPVDEYRLVDLRFCGNDHSDTPDHDQGEEGDL